MVAKYIFFFMLINFQTIRAADNQSPTTGDLETIIRNPKEFHDRLLVLKNRIDFCDAEIAVVSEMIPVHKIILASSSEYFEKVFTENESRAEIELFDMDVETVKSLIEYCYTGVISVTEKNFHKIMSSANFLKITPIVEGCSKILERKIDSSNCLLTWKLTKLENYEDLRKNAFEYIRQNYEEISRSSEFLDLGISEILEILNSDIAVSSEIIVFNSVKKWVNHEIASRKQYLDELSSFIKFENLPKNILLSESHDLCSVNQSYECLAKILNALKQKEKNNFECGDNSCRNSNSTLMAVGSFSKSKTFEIFDLRNDKWIKIENFKCDRTHYSAVLLEHKVLLIGGRSNRAINTVQSYDLNTGEMENLPPMKYARYLLRTIEFKGIVYAIGGHNDTSILPYVEMWDPVLKIWKTLTSMSIARHEYQASVLDDEIIVAGGYNDVGIYLTDVESYNPVTSQWRKRTSMNEKRCGFGVAVVSGYLYAVGGFSSGGHLNTAERYDPKTDKWTMIHSLNQTRYGMGAANLFGKLVIVGGYSNGVISTMEMYDDENDNWTSMPSLNDPRRYFNAVKIPWQLAKTILLREVPK